MLSDADVSQGGGGVGGEHEKQHGLSSFAACFNVFESLRTEKNKPVAWFSLGPCTPPRNPPTHPPPPPPPPPISFASLMCVLKSEVL